MKLVLDNINSEHYKWLTEMAKTLHFDVIEVKMSENEEDAYLLTEMNGAVDEPDATEEEVTNFKIWLRAAK